VPKKYEKKLQEIAKVGLCRYYRPMPAELEQTTSPVRVVTESEYAKQMKENETAKHKSYPITKDRQKFLLEKYGKDNWYEWAYENWGTKWGCYDNECDDGTYRFTSAWGPIDANIILEFLVKDIPTFSYSYEEEQGWGAEFEFEDGEETNALEWDLPDWEDTDNDEISFLPHKYQNGEGIHLKGYYLEYNLQEYLGENLEEAITEINESN
tara:strand:- start:502 stop:1131 length:630 start_codon:yes stop_codon:yes gene_type:complete